MSLSLLLCKLTLHPFRSPAHVWDVFQGGEDLVGFHDLQPMQTARFVSPPSSSLSAWNTGRSTCTDTGKCFPNGMLENACLCRQARALQRLRSCLRKGTGCPLCGCTSVHCSRLVNGSMFGAAAVEHYLAIC